MAHLKKGMSITLG